MSVSTTNPDSARKLELTAAASLLLAMVLLIVAVQQLSQRRAVEPPLEPIVVFPDFASIPDVSVKKQQFFDYLEDYVVAENHRIARIRAELEGYAEVVYSGVALSGRERQRVLELAEQYRVDVSELSDRGTMEILLRRVDQLPVSMALAQAANESAWGTSRFALEGNNLFGQWCYEEGCGIVPSRRREGATHEVERFESVAGAVRAYLHNINTHPSYRYLREIREDMRNRDLELDPLLLTTGLARYSERRDHYIDEIQTMIVQNDLQDRDRLLADYN